MKSQLEKEISDIGIRHFIYATFAGTARPPTTLETADHFKITIAAVENAYERLASVLMGSGWPTPFRVFRQTM